MSDVNQDFPPLAQYIAELMAGEGKTAEMLAQDCGFSTPGMVALMLDGTVKFPIEKLPEIAQALRVEGSFLLSLAMKEYMPDLWKVYTRVMIDDVLGFNEHLLVHEFRATFKTNKKPKIIRITKPTLLIMAE